MGTETNLTKHTSSETNLTHVALGSLTNGTKHTGTETNQNFGSSGQTWDQHTETWDQSTGTWDRPEIIALQTKNITSESNITKH